MSKKAFSGPSKTLSDQKIEAPKPAPKPKSDPNVLCAKFEFQIDGKTKRVDSKFAIAQKAIDLYTFLEEDVFLNPEGLEILQSYPKLVIPRDENKTLGSLKLRGQVLLQVHFKSPPKLRRPLE